MKIFYATDLHGNELKFNKVIKLQDDYDVLLLGADILPKVHFEQYQFIRDFLPGFFDEIKIHGCRPCS